VARWCVAGRNNDHEGPQPKISVSQKISHQTRPGDRIPFLSKLAVGVGGFPYWNGSAAVQYMAQPIYQIFLGLNPVLFGIAMTIPRLLDAFTDPVMGMISDRFRSPWGRRRPFVFVGAIGMAFAFSSIWLVQRSWPEWAMFAWLITTSILFFLTYTMFSVPLSSLTYEMTPDYHERTRFMAFWGFFVTLGTLSVIWLAPMTNWAGFANPLVGARWVALGLGVVAFAGIGVLPAIFGRERFYAVAQKEGSHIGFLAAMKQATCSRPMMALVGMILALNFCSTIAGSIAQYIIIYYVKGGDVPGGIALNALNGTGFAIMGFTAIPVISWLATRLGKRRAMQLVLGLAVLGGISKWFIFTPKIPSLLLLDSVLNGPIWVAISLLLPSMMADLCDWDEDCHGERREGIIGSVFLWITKVGTSLTFLVSGIALQFSGFNIALGTHQSEHSLTIMRMFFVVSSILAPGLGMLFLLLYPITEKKAYEIRARLEKRRGAA
jgi:GPH family glycoside/pentoside/hexuronide:cation symporter